MTSPDRPPLLVVDDDQLSRELLALLAADAGFHVQSFDSGLALLEHLSRHVAPRVIVLADMQMPGLCGDSLATLARSASDPQSTMLAMSGSPVRPELRRKYDAFLLKPFTMDQLAATLDALAGLDEEHEAATAEPGVVPVLNRRIFDSLAETMPAAQLQQLYQLCVDDTARRAEGLRKAAAAGDLKAWRAAAHAVKGGSLMVGATEIATLATKLEQEEETLSSPDSVPDLLRALERFERILVQHLELPTLHSPTQHSGDA